MSREPHGSRSVRGEGRARVVVLLFGFGFPDGFVDPLPYLFGRFLEFGDPLPEAFGEVREALRPEEDQDHDKDDDHLLEADSEHIPPSLRFLQEILYRGFCATSTLSERIIRLSDRTTHGGGASGYGGVSGCLSG